MPAASVPGAKKSKKSKKAAAVDNPFEDDNLLQKFEKKYIKKGLTTKFIVVHTK